MGEIGRKKISPTEDWERDRRLCDILHVRERGSKQDLCCEVLSWLSGGSGGGVGTEEVQEEATTCDSEEEGISGAC